MRPPRLLPLLLVPLLALLAGCSSSPRPDFTVPDDADPEATIRAAGNATELPDPYVLRIEVRHESTLGDGLPGVPVVFFDSSQPADVEAARTGPDGVAVARFFVGGTISIAAGGMGLYTVEEAQRVVLGEPGEQETLTLVLYDAQREAVLEETFPSGAAVGLPGVEAYTDMDIRFSDDEEVNAAYLSRLASIAGTLEWDNTPAATADFFAGLRSADDRHAIAGDDRRQAPTDTGNLETVAAEGDAARDLGLAAAAGGGLQARAATHGPLVAPDGLPFSFTVLAGFEGSGITIQ